MESVTDTIINLQNLEDNLLLRKMFNWLANLFNGLEITWFETFYWQDYCQKMCKFFASVYRVTFDVRCVNSWSFFIIQLVIDIFEEAFLKLLLFAKSSWKNHWRIQEQRISKSDFNPSLRAFQDTKNRKCFAQ